MKFYYLLELFCPGIFDESEKYAKLHREWDDEWVYFFSYLPRLHQWFYPEVTS